MLNPVSRAYFTRAYPMSGSALGSYVLWKTNHWKQIRECSKLYEVKDVVDYLKTANSSDLLACHPVISGRYRTYWLPCIEKNPENAFMTEDPLVAAQNMVAMDAMFSVTTKVC